MKKFFLIFATLAFVAIACNPKDDPAKPDDGNNQENPDDNKPEEKPTITIDGSFDDWAAMPAEKVKVAKNASDGSWEAVKEIRVYANEEFVFYYIEFQKDTAKELLDDCFNKNSEDKDGDGMPIRLCINTDGEFESGYTSYFLDGYDFIIEGSLASENGVWGNFDGNFYQRIEIDGKMKWYNLKEAGNGICAGAGKDNKYEIMVIRAMFNAAALASPVPMQMGDNFQTGIRFYDPWWAELSNMPNENVSDDNTNGYGHLLDITVDK
ncbi:MAG: hypothetical protein J5695_02915 [Bacteroidales bacterium]|nr:hypothetical protein [Bacteroidales bacterium]MBO4566159.1 hypothetical protein [Bacteroidales bacterium]